MATQNYMLCSPRKLGIHDRRSSFNQKLKAGGLEDQMTGPINALDVGWILQSWIRCLKATFFIGFIYLLNWWRKRHPSTEWTPASFARGWQWNHQQCVFFMPIRQGASFLEESCRNPIFGNFWQCQMAMEKRCQTAMEMPLPPMSWRCWGSPVWCQPCGLAGPFAAPTVFRVETDAPPESVHSKHHRKGQKKTRKERARQSPLHPQQLEVFNQFIIIIIIMMMMMIIIILSIKTAGFFWGRILQSSRKRRAPTIKGGEESQVLKGWIFQLSTDEPLGLGTGFQLLKVNEPHVTRKILEWFSGQNLG